MPVDGVKRKLRAILSADVKGYSRMMGEDEIGTHQTLMQNLESIRSIISEHDGRIFSSPGDAVMVEFASVVDAVECAVELQERIEAANADVPEDRKMQFRIGVNLGDVIHDGEQVYGDGVNIAARIESIGEPGAVSISQTVYDHAHKKLKFGYEYQGEHQVKNITEPVRVYKILTDPEAAGKLIGAETKPSAGKWIWPTIVLAAIFLTLVGYQVYQKMTAPEFEPASVENMAHPLPEKPSIAVLPFDNMSGNPKEDYLGDGLTEQIITSLSVVPDLFVIARNSSFSFKGKAVKVQQVAEELGVQYVLEGSIQKAGKKVRVNAQLIDAITGRHLWAETYDSELEDIFALQDEITLQIISAVGAEVTKGERALILARGTQNIEVYAKVMEGYEHFYRQGKEENMQARKLAEEAIEMDPNSLSAFCLLGGTYLMDPFVGSTDSAKKSWDEAVRVFQKVLAADEAHPIANGGLAFVYGCQRKYDKALDQVERAIELNPGVPIVQLGYVYIFLGRYEEALRHIKETIRLDPKGPTFYFLGLGHAYRGLKQYEEAIKAYKKALEREPDYLMSHIFLAATYNLAGKEEQARAEAAEVLRLQPKFSVEKLAKAFPYKDKDYLNDAMEALRKAGLPDKPPLPLPDKPSIAVLPFVNMSGDPEQAYFSDGITENIITTLSKTRKLFVISSNSSFTYKGRPVKVQEVGRELGVQYVLEGSIRREGERVRITAQLIDTQTDHHLWAETYDRELEDIFNLQDEITMEIIAALQVELTDGEQAHLIAKGTKNVDAYLKLLKMRMHHQKHNEVDNAISRRLAEEAIALDPEYSKAYAFLAWTHFMDTIYRSSDSPKESMATALEMAQKALELNPAEVAAISLLSIIRTFEKQYEKAISEAKRTLEIEPNFANGYCYIGRALHFMGRNEESIAMYKKAMRLNPFPPSFYHHYLCWSYMIAGQYEEAKTQCKKTIEMAPKNLFGLMGLAAAYGLSGQEEEARSTAKEITEVNPKFSIDFWSKKLPYENKADKHKFINGLRKAGLPE
jgi:adenylate cyclase